MLLVKFVILPVVTGLTLLISAKLSPTPSTTPIVTPVVILEPITDERLAYVQRKLINEGFEEPRVNQLLTDSRRKEYPPLQVSYKPVSPATWNKIRAKLYSAEYVQRGKDYITAHQEVFDRAEEEFGVPKGILVGIIAIETEFGKNTGETPTFNAVFSRMSHKAADNWEGEAKRLVALSQYCLEADLDCYEITGSYAGAMGLVQFMPDSLQNYGVDGNEDALVDLHDPVDAIPSAANFLKGHGWAQNQRLALTRYYGNSVGYPEIGLHYATLVSK